MSGHCLPCPQSFEVPLLLGESPPTPHRPYDPPPLAETEDMASLEAQLMKGSNKLNLLNSKGPA